MTSRCRIPLPVVGTQHLVGSGHRPSDLALINGNDSHTAVMLGSRPVLAPGRPRTLQPDGTGRFGRITARSPTALKRVTSGHIAIAIPSHRWRRLLQNHPQAGRPSSSAGSA